MAAWPKFNGSRGAFSGSDSVRIQRQTLAGEALRYRVVKVLIGLVTPSLLPLESIDSTV